MSQTFESNLESNLESNVQAPDVASTSSISLDEASIGGSPTAQPEEQASPPIKEERTAEPPPNDGTGDVFVFSEPEPVVGENGDTVADWRDWTNRRRLAHKRWEAEQREASKPPAPPMPAYLAEPIPF